MTSNVLAEVLAQPLVCVCTCSQVRFMLETMLALKNNDMRKIPGYDPEPVERLRKLQRTLVGDFFFFLTTSLFHYISEN